MNNADLLVLEKTRLDKLKSYQLDQESLESFRCNLRKQRAKVSQEEADKLGKELYDFIKKDSYNENTSAIDTVKDYINKGANLEYCTTKKGDFSLLLCARRNLLKTFVLLIKLGADFNRGNNYLTTPVMTSARNGNKDILEILILLGADINARCLDGDNALMSAKRHNQKECFDMLKKANVYFGTRNILNQTVRDIPSAEEFDFSGFFTFEDCLVSEITFEKTQDLLKEAEQKLTELSGGIEVQIEEPKQKRREFKRVM